MDELSTMLELAYKLNQISDDLLCAIDTDAAWFAAVSLIGLLLLVKVRLTIKRHNDDSVKDLVQFRL